MIFHKENSTPKDIGTYWHRKHSQNLSNHLVFILFFLLFLHSQAASQATAATAPGHRPIRSSPALHRCRPRGAGNGAAPKATAGSGRARPKRRWSWWRFFAEGPSWRYTYIYIYMPNNKSQLGMVYDGGCGTNEPSPGVYCWFCFWGWDGFRVGENLDGHKT